MAAVMSSKGVLSLKVCKWLDVIHHVCFNWRVERRTYTTSIKVKLGSRTKLIFFIVKALTVTRVARVSSLSLLLPSTLLLGYTKVACRQTHPVLTLASTHTDTHGLRSHLLHTADNTTYPQQSSNQKNSFLSPAFSLCCPD